MNKALIALLIASLSGCISTPTLRKASPDLPQAWPSSSPRPQAGEGPGVRVSAIEDWWTQFNDPALTALVNEALQHNNDLLTAAARIEEARAALGLSEADRRPEVQIGGSAGRTRVTEKGSFPPPSPVNNKFQVNLQAAYEVDLWDRYRQASAAARADLLASQYAREVVRASLVGNVAQSYFQIAALDAALALTRDTLNNRREAVGLHQLRFDAGIVSELPLRQAEAELATLEATQADLARQLRQQETALALLLGRSPRGLVDDPVARGKPLDTLTAPPAIPGGLPSDLLARRPDIRQAEQRMVGAEARVLETRAAIYPSLSLTANLGSESKALSNLFSGPATIWGIGASLVQTLYNAGRTEAALKGDAARQEQALLAYEQTLRVAFKEVLDALVTNRQAREAGEAENRRAQALARAAELAGLRYQNGVSNYLEVLDAQRNLYQAEQNRIEASRAQLAATATLFKALGGGWLPRPETSHPGERG
ncbi:MAG: efflux transporter outer membrane subunit [Gallionellaceae bacterium]|nr:efflux transporter outer membrane subunit [Gallionellaceae bacterium]